MKVERIRPTVLRLTGHALEVAALVSAARWVVETTPDGLPDDAVEQLRGVLSDYDRELANT